MQMYHPLIHMHTTGSTIQWFIVHHVNQMACLLQILDFMHLDIV